MASRVHSVNATVARIHFTLVAHIKETCLWQPNSMNNWKSSLCDPGAVSTGNSHIHIYKEKFKLLSWPPTDCDKTAHAFRYSIVAWPKCSNRLMPRSARWNSWKRRSTIMDLQRKYTVCHLVDMGKPQCQQRSRFVSALWGISWELLQYSCASSDADQTRCSLHGPAVSSWAAWSDHTGAYDRYSSLFGLDDYSCKLTSCWQEGMHVYTWWQWSGQLGHNLIIICGLDLHRVLRKGLLGQVLHRTFTWPMVCTWACVHACVFVCSTSSLYSRYSLHILS